LAGDFFSFDFGIMEAPGHGRAANERTTISGGGGEVKVWGGLAYNTPRNSKPSRASCGRR
jgi:hypothetical protein